MRSAACVFALVGVVFGFSGCGYSTAELYRQDVNSIALPIFENRTFERGVEADFAEALAKEVQRRTPYALAGSSASGFVASAGGDTELTGTITAVRRSRLSRTADTGLPQELEVRVIADVQWRDRRSGEVLMERRGLEEVGRYIPAGNVSAGVEGGGVLGEPFSVAQHAAVARLAQAVVDAMRSDF
ncbi:MAG: LPS assembly lipoprotein LptE [Planctomycetota bacterium]